MTKITLELTNSVYGDLRRHLLPDNVDLERAAFIFAKAKEINSRALHFVEWTPITEDELTNSSEFGISLSERAQARVIKKAHDLNATLIECHTHPFQKRAQFSSLDMNGFLEFVPHVMWRLKGKPYVAFVFGQTSFDALAWTSSPRTCESFDGLIIDGRLIRPTELSLNRLRGGLHG